MVLVEQAGNPILRSVFEKVEEMVRKWREKAVDYEELYDSGVKIIVQIKDKLKQKQELGLSDLEFGIYETISGEIKGGKKACVLAKDIHDSIVKHIIPGWEGQAVLRQNVSRIIREKVRQLKATDGLSLEEINNLSQIIFNSVEQYAQKGGKV